MSGVLVARRSASSCFGGRNTRSHTMSSCALNRLYTVWKPRLDMPTQYVLGKRAPRANDRRAACGCSRFLSRGFLVRVRAVARTSWRRRRSRRPWIFLLYHRERAPGEADRRSARRSAIRPRLPRRLGSALLPTEEGRDVEGGVHADVRIPTPVDGLVEACPALAPPDRRDAIGGDRHLEKRPPRNGHP